MALQTMEAPAGAGMYVLCPNCSRMHEAEEYAPTCKRCGTAMKEQEKGTSESSRIPRK
jgi:uncharacterized protein (DUF983 family)